MRLTKYNKLILIFALLFVNAYLHADTKFQTDFVGSIESSIPHWVNISTHAALKIFTILWCFETFNQIVFKNVLGNDLKQLPIYLLTRICFAGFFTACLLKPDFYLGIIQYFGSLTTPVTVEGNLIKGFDAGWIIAQFTNWTTSVYNPAQNGITLNIGQSVANGFLYDIYMLSTCAIALMVIILEVQIYITIFGALVLTGFAGSSWTYGIWNRYLDTVIALGIRTMVFGMLYGIIGNLVSINTINAGALTIVDSTVSIVLATACLWIIPSQIAGMVSGMAAGHSLALAVGTALGSMALGKKMMSKLPSFNGGGGNGGGRKDSSPSHDPNIPRSPMDSPIPNPGKSSPTKQMPPEYINKSKTK